MSQWLFSDDIATVQLTLKRCTKWQADSRIDCIMCWRKSPKVWPFQQMQMLHNHLIPLEYIWQINTQQLTQGGQVYQRVLPTIMLGRNQSEYISSMLTQCYHSLTLKPRQRFALEEISRISWSRIVTYQMNGSLKMLLQRYDNALAMVWQQSW